MMLINQSNTTSATQAITASSFPNVYLGVSGLTTGAEVHLERQCEDSVWRRYPDFSYISNGARVLSVPAGNYRVAVSGGPATAELLQL